MPGLCVRCTTHFRLKNSLLISPAKSVLSAIQFPQLQPRCYQPPHLWLQATPLPPFLSFVLLSQHLSPVLCTPTQQLVFLRHGKAVLLRVRHPGCLRLFTPTHPQPAVMERMEDFFIKVLLVLLLQYKPLQEAYDHTIGWHTWDWREKPGQG